MFAKFTNILIKAVSVALPKNEISLEDEIMFYGNNPKKLLRAKQLIGFGKRRIACQGQTASDLCYEAAMRILLEFPEAMNADALIFVSQTPDFDLPATACLLQDRLGLSQNCASFDVNQGCSGYVYGLWLASTMIASGACRQILLLAGDVPMRPRDVRNRVVAPVFGDGGSATLLAHAPQAEPIYFSMHTDGRGFDTIIIPAGAARLPFTDDIEQNKLLVEDIIDKNGIPWRLFDVLMDGRAVFDFTMRVIPPHIEDFLTRCSISVHTLDFAILHQANRQIVHAIADKIAIPKEKVPTESFGKYGNLSSASIPTAICDLFGTEGNTKEKTILLCGYGVGLSWGSCLWRAEKCRCFPVIEVTKPAASREEMIAMWRNRIKDCKDASR